MIAMIEDQREETEDDDLLNDGLQIDHEGNDD